MQGSTNVLSLKGESNDEPWGFFKVTTQMGRWAWFFNGQLCMYLLLASKAMEYPWMIAPCRDSKRFYAGGVYSTREFDSTCCLRFILLVFRPLNTQCLSWFYC